jgi:hypothetical protein
MKSLALKRLSRRIKPETLIWAKAGFAVPVPSHIKIKTLLRHSIPNSDWIETGTYLAETTISLARKNQKNIIYTIEPAESIYNYVKSRYSRFSNIKFLKGSSEDIFEETLENTEGSVNLWLDGHYSGDVTFKGELESPIICELNVLAVHAHRFTSLCVFVDDFRLFGSASGYPPKNYLVEWSQIHNFSWLVENDIFVARKR